MPQKRAIVHADLGTLNKIVGEMMFLRIGTPVPIQDSTNG